MKKKQSYWADSLITTRDKSRRIVEDFVLPKVDLAMATHFNLSEYPLSHLETPLQRSSDCAIQIAQVFSYLGLAPHPEAWGAFWEVNMRATILKQKILITNSFLGNVRV